MAAREVFSEKKDVGSIEMTGNSFKMTGKLELAEIL